MENDTPNWFEPVARQNFENYLSHLAGKPNLRFVQVGVFAGHASEWLLKNILTDQSSQLLDIDTWEGSDEHTDIDFTAIHKEYLERVVSKFTNIYSVVADSAMYLTYLKKDYSDFIYIDGDHRALAVINDAENAWPLLKSGGILAFDDYLWTDQVDTPKEAVDRFIATHNEELDVLHHGYQVWVQKR
jgi:predicted O-methyltransferase YrrM